MDGVRAAAGPEPAAPPARINRVLQDSSLYLLGNVAGRVVGFLTIPFYASFLNPAQYGLIELVELSTQTVAIAFGLQAIGSALSRLFHDQQTPESEQAVVSTSLIATAVLSAIVAMIAVASAQPLSELMFQTDEWAPLLQAAFIAMFFSNMIEVVLVYERIRNNVGFFLGYTLITLAATLGLNIWFIGFLHMGVWGFVSSKLVVSTLSCAYMAVRMRRDVGWHWRQYYVPELARLGAPLILSSLSYFAIHFSDRFFLSANVSLAELGRYALAYKFAILVSALVGDSFAKSWSVTLYKYVDRADWRQEFARVASYLTYILFGTGLGIALFSPELLQVMVPPDYLPPPLLLPIVIASYLAREIGDFFRSLLLINKRAGMVGGIAAGGAALNLVANFLLIPAYGIYGAAVATLLTWVAYMVVCWLVANHEHRLPIHPAAYLRITALIGIVYALAAGTRVPLFPVQVMLDGFWLLVFALAAVAVFFTAGERAGAAGLAGSMVLWGLAGKGCDDTPSRLLLLTGEDPAHPGPAATLAAGLRHEGVAVTLMTAWPGPALPGVVRVPPGNVMGQPWRARVSEVLLRALSPMLLPRTERLGWFAPLFTAGTGLAGPETVLLSGQPGVASHLAALGLKRQCGSAWIADLRGAAGGTGGRRRALLGRWLERTVLEAADAILADDDTAAGLQTRHPAWGGKVHVLHTEATDVAHIIITLRGAVAG